MLGCRVLQSAIFIATCYAAFGQEPWQRTYGGWGADWARDVMMNESGFLLCGSTGSFGTGGEVYVLQVDQAGGLLWSMLFGGSGVDVGTSICPGAGGGFLLAGFSASPPSTGYDGLLVHCSPDGSAQWERRYGGVGWQLFNDVAATGDGFYVVGEDLNSGNGDAWLLRLDQDGDTVWTRTTGGIGADRGLGLFVTASGGVIACGEREQLDGSMNAFVDCWAANGELLWGWESNGVGDESAHSVAVDANGNVFIGGDATDIEPYRTMTIDKLDANGSQVWQVHTTGPSGDWAGRQLSVTMNNTVVLAGSTEAFGNGGSDFYMLHVDGDGNYLEGPTFGGADDEVAYGLCVTDDGGYVMVGSSNSYGPGTRSVYAVRHYGSPVIPAVEVVVDPVSIPETPVHKAVIWPTLLDPEGVVYVDGDLADPPVRMTLLDAAGRVVRTGPLQGAQIALNGTPAGPYLLELGLRSGRLLRQRLVVQ